MLSLFKTLISLALCAMLTLPASATSSSENLNRQPTATHGQISPPLPLITPEHVQEIYRHLIEHHWVPETGLFISFLGTGDLKLAQQASTYEQGAVGLLAIRLGDLERARRIFKFCRQAWIDGPLKPGPRQGTFGLTNFYNAEFGGEGIEKIIHVGPNAWAGLLAARLGNTTQDREALEWAWEVAHWIAHDIPHRDGGVAMGPLYGADNIPWPKVYSTENNLSYYALLTELSRSSALSGEEDRWIAKEKEGVENWLVQKAFDPLAYHMNRGLNPAGADRVRALDTITWLISAIGPERLLDRGIDPDKLMEVAERSFEVQVNGRWGVDPTDQPEADATVAQDELNLRRQPARPNRDQHRLIWYEGLGQYINALTAMANYAEKSAHFDTAKRYSEKALFLTREFDQSALKPFASETAYGYATPGKFFHDGWWSPAEGSKGSASSLIADTWRCFAGLGMDPLSGQNIPSVQSAQVAVPLNMITTHKRPTLLYGTSEDMTVYAWQALDRGELNLAIQQAQATIQEWSEWAKQLQDQKARQVGDLLDYTGLPDQRKKIFGYWALNDVAAAYFIMGKAFDQQRAYARAAQAFQQMVLHYPLAQIWDPKGWFWSPIESFRNEYVRRDPIHYGNVLPQILAESSFAGKQPN